MPTKKRPDTFDLPTLDDDKGDRSDDNFFDLPTIGEDGPPIDAPSRVEVAAAVVDVYETAFKARAKTEQDRLTVATDSEYWACFCFESRAQKDAFLKRLKLDGLGDKHINGLEAAKRLGVPFSPEERVKWPKRRGHANLAKLAGD